MACAVALLPWSSGIGRASGWIFPFCEALACFSPCISLRGSVCCVAVGHGLCAWLCGSGGKSAVGSDAVVDAADWSLCRSGSLSSVEYRRFGFGFDAARCGSGKFFSLVLFFFRVLILISYQPRVFFFRDFFLNVRDGNFLSLIQSQLLVLFSFEKSSLCLGRRRMARVFWVASLGFMAFQPFFNAWLTQGRALLLCLFMAIALLFWYGVRRRSRLHCTIGAISLGSGILAFAAYMMLRLQVSVSSGAAGLASLVDRADGGRFELWRVWLESGLSHSIWWGHGLGYLPFQEDGFMFTPHNLLVQLVSDAGLCGLGLMVIVVLGLRRCLFLRFFWWFLLPILGSFMVASVFFGH
jgi:hypothetical protein